MGSCEAVGKTLGPDQLPRYRPRCGRGLLDDLRGARVTGPPLPGPEEARAELQSADRVAPPFWKTRAWWSRAGRTAIAAYLATVLAFLATLVVARGLGPQEFGTVVLAVAVATLFATLLDLTLEEAVVHHGYRALVDNDAAAILGLIRASLVLDIAIGVVVAGTVVLLAAPLADLASAGRLDPGLVRLAALVPLASTADSTMNAVLQLAGRPDLRGWAMAWTNLARLGAVLIAVQIGTAEAIIVAYASGNAVGSIGNRLLAWRLVRRRWRTAKGSRALRVPRWELVRFGFHTSIATSVAAANGALVPIVLGRVAGPTAVGLFRVAMFPVFVADSASGPIRMALYPEQARLSAQGDLSQLRQAIRNHTLAALALSLPVAVAGWFALPWLLPLFFSDQFDDAVLPARILLIAAVVRFSGAWFKTLPAALGRPELRSALAVLELVVMISLIIVLGGQGSEGAAIAFTVASIASRGAAIVGARVLLRRAEVAAGTGAGTL
jgi:O-antigen/teichoic acid export membrane protein